MTLRHKFGRCAAALPPAFEDNVARQRIDLDPAHSHVGQRRQKRRSRPRELIEHNACAAPAGRASAYRAAGADLGARAAPAVAV